ncbi:MAG: ABC transporter substrate-binding protein [Butyrivibrio sp.]|nr:ABC transporter substrate-binding protein [Butyrivibrio sp.]
MKTTMNRQKNILNKYIKSIVFLLFFTISVIGCGNISDGEYAASVTLTGGSGKATVESPCTVTAKKGKLTARIVWSSSNYDYMIVDGKRYDKVNTEGNSEFEIPIVLDKKMDVQADTTAMSKPHLIDYTLTFSVSDSKDDSKSEDESAKETKVKLKTETELEKPPVIAGLTYESTDDNNFAKCYRIHRYSGGYAVISIDDGRNYLIVPDGKEIPKSDDKNLKILQKPLDKIYLAASGAMCQFDTIGATENIALSGIERDDWYIDSAVKMMDEGKLKYGGKYSAPNYEMMVSDDIELAIESTMILHSPKVIEKLEQLEIPVFIDKSSYEQDPLGRCEWIKIYGLLTGKEKEAEQAFAEQIVKVTSLDDIDFSGKTVSFFSVNSEHLIFTRGKDDYFAKMVEKAGGVYVAPPQTGKEGNSSYLSVSTEAYYDYARDVDILIYNAAIEDAPADLAELKQTDVIFNDMKAVKNGDVWYTDKSLYQFANKTGDIISDLGGVLSGKSDDTGFFHKLR